jgi:hypothetical protein
MPRLIDLEQNDAFGPEYDELWSTAAGALKVTLVRDRHYLEWRYKQHPLRNYCTFRILQQGHLAGYAVTVSRTIMGMRANLLVDLLVRDWGGASARQLIEAGAQAASKAGHDIFAAVAAPGSQLYSALRRSGFVKVPEWLVPRPLNTAGVAFAPAMSIILASDAWHSTWGDTDVV